MTTGMTTPALVKYRPLLIGALGLMVLPFVMPLLGLTVSTASVIVTLCIAALGLNMMMGFCGLVSFGHSAWFGIGAYAAALAQRHLLPEQIILPTLLAMLFIAVLSAVVGRAAPAPARRLLRADDAGAGGAHLHHRLPLDRRHRRRGRARRPQARLAGARRPG